ncbi:MAG: F0F1 ATP synthase subunit delta, partial [Candidatus Hydrogenedentota bacterium]
MVSRTITMRYTRALFTIASEGGLVDRVESHLELLDSTLKESEELMNMLRHPRISAEQKK